MSDTAIIEISKRRIENLYKSNISLAFKEHIKKQGLDVAEFSYLNDEKPYFNAEMGGLVYGARVVLNRRK